MLRDADTDTNVLQVLHGGDDSRSVVVYASMVRIVRTHEDRPRSRKVGWTREKGCGGWCKKDLPFQ